MNASVHFEEYTRRFEGGKRMDLRNVDYKYRVAGVFVSGLFMQIMDTTVINVALPELGRYFEKGNDALQWVVTGYLLSLAIWIPASGWLGDRIGSKRTFLCAMATFTLASALCGLSASLGEMIAFRVLQGVGGGMMVPVGTAMVMRAFPPQERAKASAVLAVPSMVAPVVGPILGGLLVDGPGWRWVFFLNLPVGVLGLAFAAVVLKEHKEPGAGALDLPGFVLSGAGLALVLYALSRAPSAGWTAPEIVTAGVVGILFLLLMVLVELRSSKPMLDLRLFADRMFRNATISQFMAAAGLLGLIFLLPLYLQQLRGLSALQAGVTILPLALGMGPTAQLTSRIYPRVGPRRMIAFGMLLVTLSSAAFLLVGLDTSLWLICVIMFFRGVGMSFAMVSLQAATFATIVPSSMGRASSLFATNRQVASAVGVAALATILIERTAVHLGDVGAAITAAARADARMSGFHDAFLALTVLGLVGLASALLIHDEDAAATLRVRGGIATAAHREPEAGAPSGRVH